MGMSVCLHARLHRPNSKTMQPNFNNFSACWLWLRPWLGLDPPRAALQYVMYFRFRGWRHVFTPWALWCVTCISERRQRSSKTIASILTKFCSTIKVSEYTS